MYIKHPNDVRVVERALPMACPFCTHRVHPDLTEKYQEDHTRLHAYRNARFLRNVCPEAGQARKATRTAHKYGTNLAYTMDGVYRALRGIPPREQNTPAMYRLVRKLVRSGKLQPAPPKSLLQLTCSLIPALSRARVDRVKNEQGKIITQWDTFKLVAHKRQEKKMHTTGLNKQLDSNNSLRAPLSDYLKMARSIETLAARRRQLVDHPGLLSNVPQVKRLVALEEVTLGGVVDAVFNSGPALKRRRLGLQHNQFDASTRDRDDWHGVHKTKHPLGQVVQPPNVLAC
jgi:hypothetical protein